MSMLSTGRLCCAVPIALLALVTNAVPGRAACNPTTDPDKTDIANARAAVAANCDCTGASTRSAYVRCAVQQANAVLANKRCAASVKRCASHSVCGKPNAVTCCLTTAVGTTCKVEKDATRCAAKHGSAGSCTSCCDTCPSPSGGPTCPAPTTTTSAVTTTTVPVSKSDWAGVYGAWSLDEGNEDAEMAQLESLGINLVIANVGLDETNLDPNFPGWTQYYDSAIAHHINLIPILWDPSKNQTVWNWTGSEFKVDPAKYPTDPGAHFFAWLHQDPERLSHTFAVYSFHEPFNSQNGQAQRTVFQNQTLWTQVHALFPDVKLYGESITHVDGCENGCTDYAGLGVYSFSLCAGKPAYSAVDVVPAPQGVDFSTELCVTSEAEVIQRAKAMLDAMYTRSHDATPAPDGTFSKFLPLIQTFVAPLPEVSRMPTAQEMTDWANEIVLPRQDRELGMAWYCWSKAASEYTTSLEYHPELFSTVKTIGQSMPH